MEEIKKYKQNRKLSTFNCDNCGEEATKPTSELKRNLALGRKNYCSRSCSASGNNKTRDRSTGNYYDISKHSAHRDEFSPFRYTLNSVKRRDLEIDINLEYLKEIWQTQNGVCPYTGISLTLPEANNIKIINICERASLDRIDSSKGYIKGNVQFISTPINYMKSTMSHEETLNFLNVVVKNLSFNKDQTISSSSKEELGALASD